MQALQREEARVWVLAALVGISSRSTVKNAAIRAIQKECNDQDAI